MAPSDRIAGEGASEDVKAFIDVFLPYADKTAPESIQARHKEWPNADTSGNGVLSLSMVERWIQRRLSSSLNQKRGTALFKKYFPAYIRAFHAARDVPGSKNKDYVTRPEFRLLVAYLCIFALAYDAFMQIDSSGDTGKVDDRKDQRLSRSEWLKGCQKVAKHGFLVLEPLADADEATMGETFDAIDNDGGGMILLAEWCQYLQKTEIEAGTDMASLVEIKGKQTGSEGGYDPITEASTPKEEGMVDRSFPEANSDVFDDDYIVADDIELSMSKSNIGTIHADTFAGSGASSDVKTFLEVFLPMAEDTDKSETVREDEWPQADTFGNGSLDLTMIERWVHRRLVSSTNSKEGNVLYKKYFSAIIRSFQATREVPEAQAADHIDRKHFRLLVSNLCFYALAIDAFSMIDDGGDSTDASESNDQRLSKHEWLEGCHRVKDHGFVALSGEQASKKATEDIFSQMDDNAGGTVLLTEFCNYLKKAEVETGTRLGQMVTGSSLNLATITSSKHVDSQCSDETEAQSRSKDGLSAVVTASNRKGSSSVPSCDTNTSIPGDATANSTSGDPRTFKDDAKMVTASGEHAATGFADASGGADAKVLQDKPDVENQKPVQGRGRGTGTSASQGESSRSGPATGDGCMYLTIGFFACCVGAVIAVAVHIAA